MSTPISFGSIGSRETIYVLLMGIAVVLSFGRSLVFGATLGPEQMGYLSVATNIAAYGMFLQLGLLNGLNRELPIRLGAGSGDVASKLVGETTVSIVFVQAVGFLFYLLVLSVVQFNNPLIKEAFVFGGLLALSVPFLQIVFLRLRAAQRIVDFSSLQAVTALLVVIIGYWSISVFDYRGPILTMVLINAVGFFVVTARWLEPANYRYFNRSDLLYLIRIGAPLMLAGVVGNLVIGMDRLFLIKYATPAEMGIYQIASMPVTFGVLCSGIVGQYVLPKLLYEFGKEQDLQAVYRKSVKASVMVGIPMLMISPLVNPVAQFVFNRWLPEYVDGLGLVLVLYLSGILIAANISAVVIIAGNRQFSLLVGSVVVALVGLGVYFQISRMGFPMIWYAYANLTLQAINFVVVLALGYRSSQFEASRIEHTF